MGTALVTQVSPLLWASSPAARGLWLSPGHQPGGLDRAPQAVTIGKQPGACRVVVLWSDC